MPRYFFTIHGKDRVQNDPDGTYLPDAEAALSYADYTIRELRKKSVYEDDLSTSKIGAALLSQPAAAFYVPCVGGGRDILVYLMSDARRFPPPWSVEELARLLFVKTPTEAAPTLSTTTSARFAPWITDTGI